MCTSPHPSQSIACSIVVRVQNGEVLLLEPPDPLDPHADGRERRDEQREEHADLGALEGPHAAQAGKLQDGEGRRHLGLVGLCVGG